MTDQIAAMDAAHADMMDAEPIETHEADDVEWTPIGVIAGLIVGLAGMGFVFRTEVQAALHTWTISTAYNHCALVIPIALWLIWDRRETLTGLFPVPIPSVALLSFPIGLVWLAAERLGMMEGRQLAVISLVQVLFLALLGWRLYLALLGPLLYLYFLVPFGEFLTPKLQDVTTWFTRVGLDILGVPAFIDGYVIEIKEGTFFVAEACAGLRFLIASIAFGVLYALMMYRSTTRRTVFIAASIGVPIVANGIRAMGIVYLGHVLGSAEAVEADHVLYGWIFFSLVILLLIALGLPFRQDEGPQAPVAIPEEDPPLDMAPKAIFSGMAVALLSLAGPGVALALNASGGVPKAPPGALTLTGCTPFAGLPVRVPDGDLGRASAQSMNCDGFKISVLTEVFSPRSTAAPVNAERRRLTRLPDADDTSEVPIPMEGGGSVPGWRLVITNEPATVSAAGLWIDGEPAVLGLPMRLHMAESSLRGSAYAPVLVSIAPQIDWSRSGLEERMAAQKSLSRLIAAHPEIGSQVKDIALKAAQAQGH
jgi:exosortase A